MNKKILTSGMLLLSGIVIGFGVNNAALSDAVEAAQTKIAVVDVNHVVSNSAQVKALQKQQEAKRNELENWLKTVKADIAKQQTEEGKAKLVKKYDAELAKKQEANRAEYSKKLGAIDDNINKVITDNAKAMGYTIVLSKNAVLYGGDDITAAVAKSVK